MNSLRIISIFWLLSIVAVAGLYTYAEINYIDPNAGKDQEQEDTGPKEITVKAVNALMEPYKEDFLPRIAEDGTTSYNTYAAPDYSLGPGPRIAILVTSLGKRKADTEYAILNLPAEVSLAFSPYVQDLLNWGEMSRGNGHEVYIEVPMEPRDKDRADGGPSVLLTNASAKQNKDRLLHILSRMQGYVGVVNEFGDQFTLQPKVMEPFLNEVNDRGLIYIDKRTTTFTQGPLIAKNLKMKYAEQSIRIDLDLHPNEIRNQLASLEDIAKRRGFALGIASNRGITLRQIEAWSKRLSRRGIKLVPVSSIALNYMQPAQ